MTPSTADRGAELVRRQALAAAGGSARTLARRRDEGRLSARERVEALCDPGTFTELDALVRGRTDNRPESSRPYGDGVVCGHGLIGGRPVCVFSQDVSVFGGSLGEAYGEKIIKVAELALRVGCPIIGINDSGGARIQEGVAALARYAEYGRLNVRSSGVIPQISLIMGSCAGGAVYSPALTDIVVMVDGTSHMFVTGPDVVRSVTGEDVSMEELGGAQHNAAVAGTVHYVASDEADALDWVQCLLGYLPDNALTPPPVYPRPGRAGTAGRTGDADTGADQLTDADRALDRLVEEGPQVAWDVHQVIRAVVDDGDLLEFQALFAANIVCGLGRIDGHSVGVVANQPAVSAGVLDIDASEKAARFVRFCDAFNIPILTLVDVPGYLPGVEQERRGIIRRGAKLLFAYGEASVPMVTVVLRKAYGGGYAVMGSKHLGADVNLAWPSAEIAVMGAAGAVEILHRRELRAAEGTLDAARLRKQLTVDYERDALSPYAAAERGFIDAVIRPRDTRAQVRAAFRSLRGKRSAPPIGRHRNMPL
ncbi:propionyl-CoA carboxylase beta chain [Frankia sp. EI5c]|uniref:acyl-CoA carboxylase subunit beta n=1 Tax=Frankia sp. EI5c TaxID=683316 RepID=UPI0007C3DE3D|nr:acyl-CoA carboxylase subunit beta [Frankia sp. EI5c]OAA27726.1 propionyl-CoA carboxylase beta chain [Frankia sp. EI5c]